MGGEITCRIFLVRFVPILLLLASVCTPLSASAAIRLGSSQTNTVTNGLVGYWPLDGATTNWATGQTRDLSGQGNTGQVRGMSTSTTPSRGTIGQGFKLNGTTGYVDVASLNNAINYSEITVSAWVYQTGVTAGNNPRFVANAHTDVDFLGFQLHLAGAVCQNNGTQINFDVGNGSQMICTDSGVTMSPNRWYFLTGTYDGAKAKIYINGKLAGTGSGSGSISAAANNVNIGRNPAYQSDYFNGVIDDVRIYNRALSAAEVAQLYKMGTASGGHSSTAQGTALTNGLVGYWPLDGATTNWTTGQTKDGSGSSNTGQLIGMSTSTSPSRGAVGQALTFAKTQNAVKMGNPAILKISGSLTISGWAYLRSTPTGDDAVILSKFNSSNRVYKLAESVDNGPIQAMIGVSPDCTLTRRRYSSQTLANNKWYHITGVYNASQQTLDIYVNGMLDNGTLSAAPPASLPDCASNVQIGHNDDAADNSYFDGMLDDVRVYNRALSASEVGLLYKNGSANAGHSNAGGPALSNGLVGYWTFDGSDTKWTSATAATTVDRSGYGYTGTLSNWSISTSPARGKIGQGFFFNGSQQITTATSPTIDGLLTTTATVAAWIMPNSVTGEHTIFSPGSDFCWWVESTNSAIGWQKGSSGGITSTFNSSSGVVQNNVWQHFAFVGTPSTLKIYRNGVLIAGTDASGITSSCTLGLRLGGTSSRYFSGIMDDLRLYNRALSDAEIMQLYNMGK